MVEDRIRHHKEVIDGLLQDIEWFNRVEFQTTKTTTAGFIDETVRLVRQHEKLIELLSQRES